MWWHGLSLQAQACSAAWLPPCELPPLPTRHRARHRRRLVCGRSARGFRQDRSEVDRLGIAIIAITVVQVLVRVTTGGAADYESLNTALAHRSGASRFVRKKIAPAGPQSISPGEGRIPGPTDSPSLYSAGRRASVQRHRGTLLAGRI
jgi:hypothetical protein